MFVDKAVVKVQAGRGGNGSLSFRHEKFVERGGPDGGDGGKGGDVIFVADERLNTLVNFRINHQLKAESGQSGDKRRKHGRNGDDLIVGVPVGTLVKKDGRIIADLTKNGQKIVIAKGGDGGFGNAHFVSSTRQTPRVAEVGEAGDQFTADLELKLLADIGLVGLPNAGKSTFLSVVTNARPEIADYPFTTLTPHLGVAQIDGQSMLIADIPGLIEGASDGKGLGDEFLKHVERTGVLLHLIDAWSNDVVADYKTIREELIKYSPKLGRRRRVVVLSKIDGLDPEIVGLRKESLQKVVGQRKPVLAFSSVAGLGLNEVLRSLALELKAARVKRKVIKKPSLPTIELSSKESSTGWKVVKRAGAFVVTGEKIEKFARRTDFNNPAGKARLRDIMKRLGIMHELERRHIKTGDKIKFGNESSRSLTY
jgi:GTP-binding protein